jgi:hypothetical protein
VSAPQRSGFGRTVVTSMVKQTVNGEVQLNYASSGVMWNLTCSAANVLDRNALNKKTCSLPRGLSRFSGICQADAALIVRPASRSPPFPVLSPYETPKIRPIIHATKGMKGDGKRTLDLRET